MITAIVLIKTSVDRIPEIAESIAALESVSEVFSVTGTYDLIAMVRVRQHEDLAEVIPGRISKIPGVEGTDTHVAFRTYSQPTSRPRSPSGWTREVGRLEGGGADRLRVTGPLWLVAQFLAPLRGAPDGACIAPRLQQLLDHTAGTQRPFSVWYVHLAPLVTNSRTAPTKRSTCSSGCPRRS